MKINTLTKAEIAAWLTEHVPSEFTSLDLGKLCSDFQEAVVKANMAKRKIVRSIKCLNCGEVHDAKTLTVWDSQFYVNPHGCTDGDYWQHREFVVKCEGCGRFLTIPDNVFYSQMPRIIAKADTSNPRPMLVHSDSKINYRTIYE